MPELRWILIVFGLALLIGIYVWGRRGQKAAAVAEETDVLVRSDTEFDRAPTYDEFEPPLVSPIEDVEATTIDESVIEPESRRERVAERAVEVRPSPLSDQDEPLIDAHVIRERGRDLRPRIEPTFGDDSVTAELPAADIAGTYAPRPEAIEASADARISATQSTPKPQTEAPTIGMSSTPPPRRIERRKIIALRLAASPQKLNGTNLKAALEAESLQHGKYDVFHRLDASGEAIFSIASMVEPGTFDLEKMPQESFPGVTLFAQLPGPVPGMVAFNELIACSRKLHAALGGTLQDERGVPLTVHRIERIRQEIREFEQRPMADSSRSNASFSPAP